MVIDDLRLRLLGGATGSGSAALLRALDDVRVVIRTGPDMIGTYTAALAAFIGITARLFGDVALEQPSVILTSNWWQVGDTDELLTALQSVRPHPVASPQRNLVVTFGDEVLPGDLGVGGDDYTVRLGPGPQPLGAAVSHALGVHGAVCLAVSQLLVMVLGPHGFSGVAVTEPYVTNLIDYTLTPAPDTSSAENSPTPDQRGLQLAVAGVGSVGTSTLALLATALAPALTRHPQLRPNAIADIVTIDSDTIDPTRNPFRYPALLGRETGMKATYFAHRLTELGLPTRPEPITVADWVRSRERPGFDGLLLSSVDTLTGRLDVADALARSTLSLGVSGLALHAQRERFADGLACPYCDYVSAAPPMTQAGAHSAITGLPVPRVLALLQEGARLTEADVDQAIATGKVPAHRRTALIGATINDLVRQAYAEAAVRPADPGSPNEEVIAVAAPQVSWFAGVLGAVEVVKEVLGLPLVDRRVDLDLSGLPPGLVRRVPADRTGRCMCRSGTRIRWYHQLYDHCGVARAATSGAS